MPRLFSHPLLTVNSLELMKLWGDLVEALHGQNGYGGHTAEIYAYRLTAYNPMAHGEGLRAETRDNAQRDMNALAANCLAALCEEFQEAFECRVEIDGTTSIREWLLRTNEHPYNWRAHVKISR